MGHGFHQASVHGKGVLNQFLAVAGDGAAPDLDAAAAEGADFHQLFPDNLNGAAPVGSVIGVKEAAVLGNQGHLGGSGAAVDA